MFVDLAWPGHPIEGSDVPISFFTFSPLLLSVCPDHPAFPAFSSFFLKGQEIWYIHQDVSLILRHCLQISRIIKKVKVAIVVQGQVTPCNNWTLGDDSVHSELIRDYNCSYFYDHEKESLHQIKMESL